jgi:hypothetical protein
MTSSCGFISKGYGIAAALGVRHRNAPWRLVGILAVVPIASIGCWNPLSPRQTRIRRARATGIEEQREAGTHEGCPVRIKKAPRRLGAGRM